MRSLFLPEHARRLATSLCLVLLLGLSASCKKKPAAEPKTSAHPADMQAAIGQADAMRRAAPAMRKAPPPLQPNPTAAVDTNDPLGKTLTDTFGEDQQKALDQVRKQLKSTRAAFDVSAKGKIVHGQLLQSVAVLELIGKRARAKAYGEIPSLAATGYIFALMGVFQLKDLAQDLAKRAITVGRKLQLGKAQRLVSQGKTLATLGGVLAGLAERYTRVLKALLTSGAEKIRVATFAAVVKGYPKVSAAVQQTLAPLLKGYYVKEKGAVAKTQMKAQLQTIGLTVQ